MITSFRAWVKQFFATGRSPFFQMHLPKESQATTKEGFKITCNSRLYISDNKLQYWHYMQVKLLDLIFILTALEKWYSAFSEYSGIRLKIFPVTYSSIARWAGIFLSSAEKQNISRREKQCSQKKKDTSNH